MRRPIIFGMLAVLVLWFGVTLLIIFSAGSFLSASEAARIGQFGDAFGAASALFAGLGSLGVVIVLAYDLRHRKEEFRPFVTIALNETKLSRASWSGSSHFAATVDLAFVLTSATSAPVLNLQMTSAMTLDGNRKDGDIVLANAPLTTDENRTSSANFTLNGHEAETMVSLLAGSGVEVSVVATYQALNGTVWRSNVRFLLSSRLKDSEDVRKTLDKDNQFEIEPSSTKEFAIPPILLEGSPVPGSWKQQKA